jgi:hypothetical protein
MPGKQVQWIKREQWVLGGWRVSLIEFLGALALEMPGGAFELAVQSPDSPEWVIRRFDSEGFALDNYRRVCREIQAEEEAKGSA